MSTNNKAGPQTAEWWIKRIADPSIRDRIMATDYYRINKGSKHESLCWALNDTVSDEEIPDIRAKYFGPDHTTAAHTDWVKEEANLLPVVQQGYKVGDYVVVTKYQNGDPVGTLSQITRSNGRESWKIMRYPDGTTEWSASECSIRPATEKEIAQAQGTPLPTESKEWVPKVGDTVICTDTTTNWPSSNGGTRWRDKLIVGEKYIIEQISNDDISIVGGPWWHDVRSFRKATPEEIRKAEDKPDKQYICTSEDGVKLYDGDMGYWIHCDNHDGTGNGKWDFHSTTPMEKAHMKSSLTCGYYKVFSTKAAAEAWIEQQNNPQQIPAEKAKNGDRIRVLEGTHKGMEGVLTKKAETESLWWVTLDNEIQDYVFNGLKGTSLQCKVIAPGESSTNQTINNQSQKPKTNKYEKDSSKQQQDSSSICKGRNLRTKVEEHAGYQQTRGESPVSIRKIKPKIVEGGY